MFFARLYDLDPQRAAQQTERYLKMLELSERRDELVGGFSKGMRQKLAIARALLHEPGVVFLDEPTAGLDPEASRTVRDFIKELRSEGRTIMLTTHNLPEADELCDMIGVFRTRLLRLGTPEDLRAALFGRGTLVRVVKNAESLAEVARKLPFVHNVSVQDNTLSISLDNPDDQTPPLLTALVGAGALIRSAEPLSHSLEEVYMQLVGNP
jgi:ABC-2 type transport system ATP-binding protein